MEASLCEAVVNVPQNSSPSAPVFWVEITPVPLLQMVAPLPFSEPALSVFDVTTSPVRFSWPSADASPTRRPILRSVFGRGIMGNTASSFATHRFIADSLSTWKRGIKRISGAGRA